MNTQVKNRIAELGLLDLDTPQEVVKQPVGTVNSYNNCNNDYSRKYDINISISFGGSNGGGGVLVSFIAIGALVWLLNKAVPFLGGFHDFFHTMGLG